MPVPGEIFLPMAPKGFSWQLDGDRRPYLVDRAKNRARAKAWRAAQKAKLGPAYRLAESERQRRNRAAHKAATEATTNARR